MRAISGEKTGFAYSDDIILPALEEAAVAARSIAHHGGEGQVRAWHQTKAHHLYPVANPLGSLKETDKIALLQSLDAEARRLDSRIKQVNVSLVGQHEIVMVINSDGTLGADVRPLVRLSISVIADENGRREQGTAGGGGRGDYQYFLGNNSTGEG